MKPRCLLGLVPSMAIGFLDGHVLIVSAGQISVPLFLLDFQCSNRGSVVGGGLSGEKC